MQTGAGQTDCERLRDLLPAYSIGALDTDETRIVEALLPNCPDVTADARAYARIARGLYYAAPDAAAARARASDELRARILKASASAPSAKPPIPFAPSSVRRLSPLRIGLGIAAALLLVSNLYWILQVQTTDSLYRDLSATQTAMLNQQDLLLNVIASPDARAVDLVTADDGRALARISWSPSIGLAVLQAANLPALAAERTYQAWLIPAEGAPISAGVFQPRADGSYTLIFTPAAPLDTFAAFGISDEPASGSDAPTTTPLAVGTQA